MAMSTETADMLMAQAYREYSNSLLAFCKNRLREHKELAEDCMNKTFMVYYNQLLAGEIITKVKAYLYKIAEDTCKTEYTNCIQREFRSVGVGTVEKDLAPSKYKPKLKESDYYDYDALAKLLVQQLDEEEQHMYTMKYEQKLTYDEMCEQLDMKPSLLARRLLGAHEKIKSNVEPVLNDYRR